MRLNVTLYRVMAYVTGVVLIVLCVFAIAQAFTNDEAIVNAIGTVHGLLYIVYLLVSYPLTRRLRLPVWPTVAVLLAGTIPATAYAGQGGMIWLSPVYNAEDQSSHTPYSWGVSFMVPMLDPDGVIRPQPFAMLPPDMSPGLTSTNTN